MIINKIQFFIISIVRLYQVIRIFRIANYNRNADFILLAPDYLTLKFLTSDNLHRVHSTFYHLKKAGLDVTIFTRKDFSKLFYKKIFIFPSKFYNTHNFVDYTLSLQNVIEMLGSQGNQVFPDINEVKYWENKIYMHKKFDELKIRTPKTIILSKESLSQQVPLAFPFIIKDPHSCSSQGVFLIKNKYVLSNLMTTGNFSSDHLIVQEQLNMRRDLRVILVGKEIVWYYWRYNKSSEWKPTSTGSGGGVDFENFPNLWKEWIIDNFKKLNIVSGAFDIAWQNDDISKEPYILEVSPFFQPNPKPKDSKNMEFYGEWKKSLSVKDNYQMEFLKLVSDIQFKYIGAIISNLNEK